VGQRDARSLRVSPKDSKEGTVCCSSSKGPRMSPPHFAERSLTHLPFARNQSAEDHPELRNCVNHIMQTRFLHGSTLDAAYPADTTDQFNPNKLTINSGQSVLFTKARPSSICDCLCQKEKFSVGLLASTGLYGHVDPKVQTNVHAYHKLS
jgi:hypothetical protein